MNPQTGLIDFDKLEERAVDYRPKILICGGSSYPREWDYSRFRQIADKCGAVLMCDMAQISGLVAAKVLILILHSFVVDFYYHFDIHFFLLLLLCDLSCFDIIWGCCT